MKIVKNILTGFIVSFAGSIPLGFLNVVGFQVYKTDGAIPLTLFILGVMSVEVIVIYLTLIFAEKLSRRKKLLKLTEAFSIFFLLALAVLLYLQPEKEATALIPEKFAAYSPYILGVALSCINFIQLPFWTGWKLYMLTGKYISIKHYLKYLYILGTLLGTFAGMYGFVILLTALSGNSKLISANLMHIIIPGIFIALAVWQSVKFYRKYLRN